MRGAFRRSDASGGAYRSNDELLPTDLAFTREFDPHPGLGSLSERSGVGIAWLSVSLAVVTVLQFGSVAVTSRLLRPADFGLIAAAALILRLVNYLAQGGMSSALVQFERLTHHDISTAFSISLTFGLTASLLGAALAPLAGLLLGSRATVVTAVMAADFLLASGGVVAIALLRRQLRFRVTAIIEIGSYATGYLLIGIPLAVGGAGVWSLVSAALTQTALSSTASFLVVRHTTRLRYHRSSGRRLLSFGTRSSLAGFLEFWGLQVDAIAVAITRGSGPLGLYTRGSVLVSIPIVQASTLTGRVLGSGFSRIGRPEALARALVDTLSVLSCVIIPVGAVLAISSPLTAGLLLGSKFHAVVVFLPFTVVGASFQGLTQLFASLSEARGLLRQRLIIQAGVLLLFVGEAALVVSFELPLLAFAVTWALTEAVRHASYFFMLSRELAVLKRGLLRAYGYGILVAVAPSLLAVALGRDFHGSVLRLAILGCGCVISWLAAIALLPRSPMRRAIRTRHLLSKFRDNPRMVVRCLVRAFS